MTSESIKSVAADSNVLLSAISGGAARRVFAVPDLRVVTTERNIAEVEEYVPEFAGRYRLPEDALLDMLHLLPLEIYDEADYATALPAAKAFIGERDEDDIALTALALKLQIPIWSNDRDFERFPYGVHPTARLLKLLSC